MAGLDRDYGGLTPMIDVVFNLLIFFVIGAGSFAADKLLATKLSKSSGATTTTTQIAPNSTPAPTVNLQLKLNAAGQPVVDMNGTTHANRDHLKSQLRTLAEISAESPINLSINPDVPLGDMIDIYDTCRAAGFETINFVTNHVSDRR